VIRWLVHRPDLATVFGLVFASHIVLDIVQHEPDLRLLPWMSRPTIGFNLQANPWADFAAEIAFSVACWAYYRGTAKLLATIIVLNLLNLPMMLSGHGGASAMAHNPYILPTVILFTIALAWALTYRYARPNAEQNETPAARLSSRTPASVA
jgi:hypothetical protein